VQQGPGQRPPKRDVAMMQYTNMLLQLLCNFASLVDFCSLQSIRQVSGELRLTCLIINIFR
jgi:hypothetical protein